MKIISKFHDYYDGCMAFGGHDDGVVYVRKHELIDPDAVPLPKFYAAISRAPYFAVRVKDRGSYDLIVMDATIIAFCGKVYRCVKVTDQSFISANQKIPSRACYDMDTLKRHMEAHDLTWNMGYVGGHQLINSRLDRDEEVAQWLSAQGTPEAEDELITNRIVVLASNRFSGPRNVSYEKDLSLKSLEFFKMFAPSLAFQEIAMYLGGVLPRLGAMTSEVADKDRIPQHGFDKWSFRKRPTK